MSIPQIQEQKPRAPTRQTANGLVAYRRWSVIAASGVDAMNILAATLNQPLNNIFAVYENAQGEQPNPALKMTSIEAVGSPEAVAGGTGNYIIDAEYSTIPEEQRAVPGGPWILTTQGSLASVQVDHDIAGNPIVTSSEEPIDPPLSVLRPEFSIHAECYVSGAWRHRPCSRRS